MARLAASSLKRPGLGVPGSVPSLGQLLQQGKANLDAWWIIVPTFVLTPLTYLGGIFYSINLLPEPWKTVSLANPILYMVNAFRHGILGVSDIGMTQAFTIIGAFILGLGAFALWLLRRGVGTRN